MIRRAIVLFAVILTTVIAAMITSSCGDDSQEQITTQASNNGPSLIVETFYQATLKNECEDVADLVNPKNPQLANRYVEDCKQYADKFVGYRILGEAEIEESAVAEFARVETEITLRENGVEKTSSGIQFLVNIDGAWKLTEIR